MKLKSVYDKGIQWFEKSADNYMPLIGVSDGFTSHEGVKHFSWGGIEAFAEVDRWALSYREKGGGDWKYVPSGGDGYPLVSVDGQPYWGDAIGQIPFSADLYRKSLKAGLSHGAAANRVIDLGYRFGSGHPFSYDDSNNYDNAMIRRVTNWAKDRYISTKQNNRSHRFGEGLPSYIVKSNKNVSYNELRYGNQ